LRRTAEAFTFLLGKASDIETLGGFLDWRYGTLFPVLFSIFTLLAFSAIIRGEEERGTLDVLLSTPHSRALVLLQKWAGLVVATFAIATISALALIGGASWSGEKLDSGAALLAHLNWSLVALLFGTPVLMFSQLVSTRKQAAGWAGGVLGASYLLNNLGQSLPRLEWLRYLTPFYYANQSRPFAPSVGMNWSALTLLVVLILLSLGAALIMYQQRDHNNVFRLFQSKDTSSSTSTSAQGGDRPGMAEPKKVALSNSFVFALSEALPGIIIWGLGIGIYIVMIVAVLPDLRDTLSQLLSGDFGKSLGFAAALALTTNENLLGLGLFITIPIFYAAYAITQVANWASEENQGRLELVLSTPRPRWWLLAKHFAASLVSAGLVIGLGVGAFWLSSALTNLKVEAGKINGAFFGIWVVCAMIIGVGYLLQAFGPSWAVAATIGFVIVSYLSDLLATLLKLPNWMVNLSIFHHYGQPVLNGLNWSAQLIMLGLTLLFIILATFRFWQRDLTK
jgi:ABC-2 type transport system permease protein